jgi:hypothetical protein
LAFGSWLGSRPALAFLRVPPLEVRENEADSPEKKLVQAKSQPPKANSRFCATIFCLHPSTDDLVHLSEETWPLK